jgi:hypothetical protein
VVQRLAYVRPNKLNMLHDQLLAAGITPSSVEGLGDLFWITVDDQVVKATVDAVVSAHDSNATAPDEVRQQKYAQDLADYRALRAKLGRGEASVLGLQELKLIARLVGWLVLRIEMN